MPNPQLPAPKINPILPQRTLFSLHGIQTAGAWRGQLSDIARRNNWDFWMGRWTTGVITIFDLLLPRRRRAKIDWFLTTYEHEMRELQLDPRGTYLPSIVVHSFGSYILGYALLRHQSIRFNHVIVCGSILPRLFPWDAILKRGQVQLVRNEYGTKDFWSRIAGWFVGGAGASGVSGFKRSHPRLQQECFPEYDHSRYFTEEHMTNYWVPFLHKNTKHIAFNKAVEVTENAGNFPLGYYIMIGILSCGIVISLCLALPQTRVETHAFLTVFTNSPVSLEPLRRNLGQQLLSAQQADGGVWESSLVHEEQVWTTAQMLRAISGRPTAKDHAAEIRRGLNFIEADRQDLPRYAERGWGLRFPAKHTITEINAWVQLAYLGGLRVPGVFQPSERMKFTSLVKERLKELVERESPNGGWSPVEVADDKYARTYSTMMAVWAISEALKNPETRDDSLIPHLRLGVRWLLRNRTPLGWIPNPAYVVKRAPGLDAECFYILSRVSQLDGFANIRADPSMLNAENAIINDDIVNTARLDDFFQMDGSAVDLQIVKFPEGTEQFELEGSSFLWPSWYIAAYSIVERDSQRSNLHFRALAQRKILEKRYSSALGIGWEEWAFAETLIGLNEVQD